METSAITSWTLVQEIPVPDDVRDLLVEGEQAVAAYKTFRDSAIFTTKRLIVRDSQGITGKKVEVYSLPYSRIDMWSSENAGKLLDFNAELEMWDQSGTHQDQARQEDRRASTRQADRVGGAAGLTWVGCG